MCYHIGREESHKKVVLYCSGIPLLNLSYFMNLTLRNSGTLYSSMHG